MTDTNVELKQDFGSATKSQPDDIDTHIGKKIRRRRKLLGLTQTQLAAQLGVRFQQVQKYECGANKVSAARLFQLGEALQVPVGYFMPNDNSLQQAQELPQIVERLVKAWPNFHPNTKENIEQMLTVFIRNSKEGKPKDPEVS